MIKGTGSIPKIRGNIGQMKTQEWVVPLRRVESKSGWVGFKWRDEKWYEIQLGLFSVDQGKMDQKHMLPCILSSMDCILRHMKGMA